MKAIYKWTNLQNNKIYIDKSVDVARRLRNYRDEVKKNKQRPIISAIRKYGFENFNFEIVEICDSLTNQEILEREQYWIDFYNSKDRNFGYNILDAGDTPGEEYSIGSRNNKARLNEEKVLNIREMIFLQNIPPAEVYKIYSTEISYDAFCKAYRGNTWKNVDTSMIRDISSEVKRKGNKKAKLTKEDVKEIRRLAEQENLNISEIYDKFLGVCTRGTIKRVVNYITWKNV